MNDQSNSVRRILVADDDLDTVEAMMILLSLEGLDVRSARDGVEALEVESVFHPEVLIFDLEMPKLTGLEAASRIRAQQQAPQRIYLVTGQPEADNLRGPSSPFDGVFLKPVDVAMLIRLVLGGEG